VIIVNYRGIKRKATEKQLDYQTYYDALSGYRTGFSTTTWCTHRPGCFGSRDMRYSVASRSTRPSVTGGAAVQSRRVGVIRASGASPPGSDAILIIGNTSTVISRGPKVQSSLIARSAVNGHELFVTARHQHQHLSVGR
jgi:hypothetical protein